MFYNCIGGDLASTWVAKPEGHVEDVTNLVKNVTKKILAKNDKLFARKSVNDALFQEDVVAVAA